MHNQKLDIREMLHTTRLVNSSLRTTSHLLNPLFDDPDEVPNKQAYPPRLSIDLPQLPPSQDAFNHRIRVASHSRFIYCSCRSREILSRLESQEGVRDHDDMHRLAEDLLPVALLSVELGILLQS